LAKRNNIVFYKGEAVTLAFTLSPLADVTGWSIVLTVRAKATSAATAIVSFATITNGPAGQFSFSLSENDTNIAPGIYAYDVSRTDTSAVLSIGAFVITQEVRR
jgi:hypothetical protein